MYDWLAVFFVSFEVCDLYLVPIERLGLGIYERLAAFLDILVESHTKGVLA